MSCGCGNVTETTIDVRQIVPKMRHPIVFGTFDMLSPQFDQPQTLGAVRRWCNEAGLNDVEVVVGYNGIEIHATTSQLGRS